MGGSADGNTPVTTAHQSTSPQATGTGSGEPVQMSAHCSSILGLHLGNPPREVGWAWPAEDFSANKDKGGL